MKRKGPLTILRLFISRWTAMNPHLPSSFLDCFQEMPWLILWFGPEYTVSLTRELFDVFPPRLPAIAAFGPDGHLETKESNLAFKNDFYSEYPFIQADMSEEVCVELM